MNNCILLRILLALFACAAPLHAIEIPQLENRITQAAPEKFPNADAVLLYDLEAVRYEKDGTFRSEFITAVKILTEKGRRENLTHSLWYDKAYGTARFLEAEIVRTDGTRTPVELENNTREMIDPGQMNANIYDPNSKIIKLNIPELKIGDTLIFRAEKINEKARVPDTFSDYSVFEGTSPILFAEYRVDAPAELPLKSIIVKDPVEESGAHSTQTNGQRIVYSWQFRDVPRMYDEPDMPARHTVVQRLLVSTIADWKELSRWYWNLCLPRLEAVTPEMRAKTEELTAGIEDRQKQIEALFYFVSQQIRYMGITVEDEAPGYEPHDVSLTFGNRYGVCRDKAALLCAMLRLAGFDAYPVLIMAGPKKDPEVPQPFFNHAIACVRNPDGSWQLMDPTDESTRDLLPRYLCDKSFLVAHPDGETLHTSAIIPAAENLVRIETAASIDESETYKAESTIRFEGVNDGIYRGHFSRMKPEERRRFFEGRLKQILPGARLTEFKLLPENIRDTEVPLQAEIGYEADQIYTCSDEMLALNLPRLARVIGTANFLLRSTGLEKREFPLETDIACGVQEHLKVSLNRSAGKPILLPDLPQITTSNLLWQRSVEYKDNTLESVSDFQLTDVRFEPDEYLQLKENLKEIEYANRKPLLFNPPAPEDDPDAQIAVLDSAYDYEILSAGRCSLTHTARIKILNYAGKKNYSELKIPYFDKLDEVEILHASVEGPDGSVKEITDKEINRMDAAWVASAPRYPPEKILIANLPGVEIGSIINLKYRIVNLTERPFVTIRESFRSDQPILRKTVTLDNPHTIPLTESLLHGKSLTAGENSWSVTGQPALKAESALPPQWSFVPTLLASTADWKTYGKQLDRILRDAAKKQPDCIAKARELTRGLKSKEAKIVAIRDFCDRNIRAAGPVFNELPLTEIAPADRTLADGYGNSADRAAVLFAMLDAARLKPRFILASGLPTVEEVLRPVLDCPQPDLYDTVLVEAGELLLNDTSHYAAAGVTAHARRPAFDLRRGQTAIIEPHAPKHDLNETVYEIALEESGAVRLVKENNYYGTDHEAFHRQFAEMPPEERDRYQQEAVSTVSQQAQAVQPLKTDYGYPGREIIEVTAEKYAVIEDGYLCLTLPQSLGGLFSFDSETRENPLLLDDYAETSIRYRIRYPDGYEPVLKPDGLQTEVVPDNRVSRQITNDPEINLLEITFNARLRPAFVQPEKYEDLQETARQLAHPENRTVIFRKKAL